MNSYPKPQGSRLRQIGMAVPLVAAVALGVVSCSRPAVQTPAVTAPTPATATSTPAVPTPAVPTPVGKQPLAKQPLLKKPIPMPTIAHRVITSSQPKPPTPRWLVKPAASHNIEVTAVAFSPDGQYFASAGGGRDVQSKDTEVALWSVHQRTLKLVYKKAGQSTQPFGPGIRGSVQGLSFSPDGKTLAIGRDSVKGASAAGLVELWDARTGKILRSIPLAQPVNSLAFSPAGDALAVASDEGVAMLSVVTGQPKWLISKASGRKYNSVGKVPYPPVQSLAFSGDGHILATLATYYGETNGTSGLHLWDAKTGKLVRALPDGTQPYNVKSASYKVAFSPRAPLVAINRLDIATENTGLTLYDSNSGVIKKEMTLTSPNFAVLALAFSPDGKTIAAAGGFANRPGVPIVSQGKSRGEICLWDSKTGALRESIKVADPITTLTFSPDGKTLATGSKGVRTGEVKLWDVGTR